MTAQDFDDYAEASLLHDERTTHLLACTAETDRLFYGARLEARKNVKGPLDTNGRKA